jgi:hypothetical protein
LTNRNPGRRIQVLRAGPTYDLMAGMVVSSCILEHVPTKACRSVPEKAPMSRTFRLRPNRVLTSSIRIHIAILGDMGLTESLHLAASMPATQDAVGDRFAGPVEDVKRYVRVR